MIFSNSDREQAYYRWITSIVCQNEYASNEHQYQALLRHLYEKEFRWSILYDQNRARDGKDLRFQFSDLANLEWEIGMDDPCSVLEMMVGLAIRCEQSIMTDSSIGDRTSMWFWDMIESLGLDSYTDADYDKERADAILDKFMDRRFSKNGKGSLFTFRDSKKDARSIEIWRQMCLYLDELIEEDFDDF